VQPNCSPHAQQHETDREQHAFSTSDNTHRTIRAFLAISL
jgi:hypothetical protein